MRSILVTRPQPVADEFAEKLRREGFNAYIAPLMEYVDTKGSIGDLSAYQACVFTSVQAVQVFCRKTEDRHLPALVVGDATARAAKQAGFTAVYSAAGDASDVIALIADKKKELSLKKVIHPCSDDTPDDVAKAVSKLGVKMVLKVVYKASLISEFPEDVGQVLRRNGIDTVTLFSARTAANFVQLLCRKEWHGVSAGLNVVCISKRVAAELRPLPWRGVSVAARPNTEAMLEALKNIYPYRNIDSAFVNRREKKDRRQNRALPDAQGNIQAGAYAGPDRRTGIDRRAHQERQSERVMQEKINIAYSAMVGLSFVFIVVVLSGALLMGPEYVNFTSWYSNRPAGTEKQESFFDRHNSLGGFINRQIERVQGFGGAMTAMAHRMVGPDGSIDTAALGHGLTQMLGGMDVLRSTATGQATLGQSMTRLRQILSGAMNDPAALRATLTAARQKDPTLDSLLGAVGWKDVAAAGMLLTLGEFRSNLGNNRPYEDDIALLQKLAGNDPEMNEALQKLAPYAKKGIAGRAALTREFRKFATNIVTAQVQGRDISVKQEALERFRSFSAATNADEIEGDSAEAVTARANLLMNQGNVEAALRELQSLRGASAAAAQPWMENAAEYLTVAESSDFLTRRLLQTMPGGSASAAESILSALKAMTPGAARPVPLGSGGKGYGSGVLAP